MTTHSLIKNLFLSSLFVTGITVSSFADMSTEKTLILNECEWDCQGWWFPSIDEIFSRSILVHPKTHYQSSMTFNENSKSYTINVLLPDIEKKDISINVINNVLVIAAERRTKDKTQQSYSSYHQSIILPENADIDKIDAKFTKGSVMITVPKTGKKTAKKVLIQ